MVIQPEVIVTPDSPTVRFREPREKVDLDYELPKILHAQGWGCGTYFNVQFISHDKTKLLASARYVVTEEDESLRTNTDNPYQPVTKTAYTRKAEQIGDWWIPESVIAEKAIQVAKDATDSAAEDIGGRGSNIEMKHSWNPGKKMHQAKIGDEVVFESKDKQEVLDYISDSKKAA